MGASHRFSVVGILAEERCDYYQASSLGGFENIPKIIFHVLTFLRIALAF